MAKFCANLSFLFTDKPFLQRYQLAKEAGFRAVESAFPNDCTLSDVIAAKEKAGIPQILMNICPGAAGTGGEFGAAAIPGLETDFKRCLHTTIDYAKALRISKIHITSGKLNGIATVANDICYENNLRFAVQKLEKENIIGLIEPINSYSIPNYYMNSYYKAQTFIKKIKSPYLKLMVDIYHLQHMKGNIVNTIRDVIDDCGHIQIAQVPNRNEPNTMGELNYRYILQEINNMGYDGWIGLEYRPLNGTKEGLAWVKEYGFDL